MNKKSVEVSKKFKKNEVSKTKGNNFLFFTVAIVVAVLSFIYLPTLISKVGPEAYFSREAGLNKLLSTVLTVAFVFFALMPSDFFKKSVALSKGARNEWRKSKKPAKDAVFKVTIMVLVMVVLAALTIVTIDFGFLKLFELFLGVK